MSFSTSTPTSTPPPRTERPWRARPGGGAAAGDRPARAQAGGGPGTLAVLGRPGAAGGGGPGQPCAAAGRPAAGVRGPAQPDRAAPARGDGAGRTGGARAGGAG